MTPLELSSAQPARHVQQPGGLWETQVADSMFPQSGFMGQFCHNMGSIISIGGLATSPGRIEASLRK